MSTFYNMDGEEVSMEQWGEGYAPENSSIRIIGQTMLPGDVFVSTVFIGMDMCGFMTSRPLIFETMVFGPEGWDDLDCDRYATKEEAQAGHDRMVTKWTGWTPGTEYPKREDNE